MEHFIFPFFSSPIATATTAFHLFILYDLCMIWCTYEWENINPCDRRLNPTPFDACHMKWANTFLVVSVLFFRNYCVHKNRSFVCKHTNRMRGGWSRSKYLWQSGWMEICTSTVTKQLCLAFDAFQHKPEPNRKLNYLQLLTIEILLTLYLSRF